MLPGTTFKQMRISMFRVFLSTCGVFYVWSLPVLAEWGFAEPGATSISGFIANAPATGAMAAISFMPLTLMWEYQDSVLDTKGKGCLTRNALHISLTTFQFFYGCFLVCTETYAPMWLHQTTVTLFGLSFITHGLFTMHTVSCSIYPNVMLMTGMAAFALLLCADGMWFWACECVAFSSMLLYTPLLWYTYVPPEDPLNQMVDI